MEPVDEALFEELPSNAPVWKHMLAGALAGVTEHVTLFPVDTIKA